MVGRLAQMRLCRWFICSRSLQVRDTNLRSACRGRGQLILTIYSVAFAQLFFSLPDALTLNKKQPSGKNKNKIKIALHRRVVPSDGEGALSHLGFLLVVPKSDLYNCSHCNCTSTSTGGPRPWVQCERLWGFLYFHGNNSG